MRRAWALLLGVSLASGLWETAVPDIHDGDAAGSAEMLGGNAVGTHTLPATQDRDGIPLDQDGPSHTMHLDHCGHAHGAGAVFACRLPMASGRSGAPARSVSAALVSVTQDPQTRPPIA